MLSLAFLAATLLASREGLRLRSPVFVPPQGAVWTLLGALLGSKLFFYIQYYDLYDDRPWYHMLYVWEGGLVFYGGLIGAFVFSAGYLYITRQMDWRIADVCAPFLALGQAIGRTGCFLNGCCWGRVSDTPWALQFPRQSLPWRDHVAEGLLESTAPASLPVHPTQLYEIAGLIAICLLLRRRLYSAPFTFAIALQYGYLYGLLRFTVEMFRGDSARNVLDMLTVSQTISLGLIVSCALAYWVLEQRHGSRAPAETQEDEAPQARAQ